MSRQYWKISGSLAAKCATMFTSKLLTLSSVCCLAGSEIFDPSWDFCLHPKTVTGDLFCPSSRSLYATRKQNTINVFIFLEERRLSGLHDVAAMQRIWVILARKSNFSGFSFNLFYLYRVIICALLNSFHRMYVALHLRLYPYFPY